MFHCPSTSPRYTLCGKCAYCHRLVPLSSLCLRSPACILHIQLSHRRASLAMFQNFLVCKDCWSQYRVLGRPVLDYFIACLQLVRFDVQVVSFAVGQFQVFRLQLFLWWCASLLLSRSIGIILSKWRRQIRCTSGLRWLWWRCDRISGRILLRRRWELPQRKLWSSPIWSIGQLRWYRRRREQIVKQQGICWVETLSCVPWWRTRWQRNAGSVGTNKRALRVLSILEAHSKWMLHQLTWG